MHPDHRRIKHAELARRYPQVRGETLALAEGLSDEDCALQSMPDASPVKWHLAHVTWFFETFVLERHAQRHEPFHPRFRYLFNSYYNALGEQFSRPQRGLLSRPGLEEIRRYRAHVDERMAALLSGPDLPVEALGLVELGLHHEQQHQELILTDFKHLLSINPLAPVYRSDAPAPAADAATMRFHAFPASDAEVGHDGNGFSFDNEMPRHRHHIPAFELASRPVTNGEYLAFMEDGGYREPRWWLSEGWAMVNAQRWDKPLYWRHAGSDYEEFTLRGQLPLELDRPATHLSHFEADAYAAWAGARLPTEFEWEVASPELQHGEVWEWTSSAYGPYPGFKPAAGAVGEYNGKFMSNQYVLRGGSCATPGQHMRRTYRNFFPSYARWQFTGVRLARDLA